MPNTYKYNPPTNELKALKAQTQQFINKPTLCPWREGDSLEIEGRTYPIQFMTNTVAFLGPIPGEPLKEKREGYDFY